MPVHAATAGQPRSVARVHIKKRPMVSTGQAYPGSEQQVFAANVQERFERLGAMPGHRVGNAGYRH